MKMKVYITAAKWFDKINGNTYHNAKITLSDGTSFYSGFQYGYGSQYRESAKQKLKAVYGVNVDLDIIGETEFYTKKSIVKNSLF